MAKPLFRIEQLISALLKGSPDDPVYLKVGPTTYGIKSITDGSIRVTTGNQTQDAAQVVKTLRRYATGTPKGEDTGIAWRIVGVGGGTAIKSVSHDGSQIVVTTLANEGKAAEDVYVHGDDGEARSIRVNKTHARNMSNLSEGATTTVKDQRKGTLHTVKRVGKGFEHAAEESEGEYPEEFLDEFYDFDSNPTADTQDEETIALAYATWLYNKEHQEEYCPACDESYEDEDEDGNPLCECNCSFCHDAKPTTTTVRGEWVCKKCKKQHDGEPEDWMGAETKEVTFEAPRKGPKPKDGRPGRKVATPSKRAHNSAVSSKISQIMRDYDKTGRIGSSKPKNRAAAIKQAVAVAYSMVNKDYSKSGKRLPTGVRRAENQDMMCCGDQMEFHEDYFYCPVCETSIETDEFKAFGAPMGYAPDGPRPFYGNPRKLVRDRWGNLRFIRRRKDGTYMDNVDFGRSIRADRQRQAKTWAPGGFRDQGDGSLDLLTSLMGAEDWGEKMTLEQRAKALSEMTWEQVDGKTGYGDDLFAWHKKWDSKTPSEREAYALKELTDAYGAESGDTIYMINEEMHDTGGELRYYQTGPYATEAGAQDALKTMMEKSCDEWSQHWQLAGEDITFDLVLTDDGFLEIKPSNGSLDDFMATYTMTGRKSDREFSGMLYRAKVVPKQIMAAESNDTVWLVESWMDGVSDGARLFSKESDARAVFEEYIRNLRGDPADAPDGDWVADMGFQRVMMYQVTIE